MSGPYWQIVELGLYPVLRTPPLDGTVDPGASPPPGMQSGPSPPVQLVPTPPPVARFNPSSSMSRVSAGWPTGPGALMR